MARKKLTWQQAAAGAALAAVTAAAAYLLLRPAPEPTVGRFITEEEVLGLVEENAPESAFLEYPHLLEGSGIISPLLPMKIEGELCWLSVRQGSVVLLDETRNEVLKTYR